MAEWKSLDKHDVCCWLLLFQTGIISIPLTNSTETEFPYYSLLINLISKSSVTAIFPVWTGEPEDELMVTHFFSRLVGKSLNAYFSAYYVCVCTVYFNYYVLTITKMTTKCDLPQKEWALPHKYDSIHIMQLLNTESFKVLE